MSKLIFLLFFTLILCQTQKTYKKFTFDEIEKLTNDKSVFLVDTRDFRKILKKGIVPNSIVVSLRDKYNSTLTNLIDKNAKLILITDKKNSI